MCHWVVHTFMRLAIQAGSVQASAEKKVPASTGHGSPKIFAPHPSRQQPPVRYRRLRFFGFTADQLLQRAGTDLANPFEENIRTK